MKKDKRPAEEYSIEELEALLSKKKLEVHASRLKRFRETGRTLPLQDEADFDAEGSASEAGTDLNGNRRVEIRKVIKTAFNRLLLWIEIAAIFGMAFVFFKGFGLLQTLNREVAEAIEVPTPTPWTTARPTDFYRCTVVKASTNRARRWLGAIEKRCGAAHR